MTGSEVLERGRPVDLDDLRRRADWVRLRTIQLIDAAGLGHYSSTFSCAEILAVLYYHTLRLRPEEPAWPDRDRFLLGKGHVAVGLWPILADLGCFPAEWLDRFGRPGTPLNDHPNMRTAPGIDFSTGSLGHNLSVGGGMGLAARLQDRDYRTFVLTGDGSSSRTSSSAATSWPSTSAVIQPNASNRAAMGSTFMACDVGPPPENPLASTIAITLPRR